ncbi:MAG TPA: hypothetical protein VNL37_04910 [Candidatus Polarisedimenticolia bacterium]|nr:hypothetical protein [Candidatus Polarisedimenticolia bacterium]
MSPHLKDRVETEANRLLRERVARLRRLLDDALGSLAVPLELPLSPGEWGAAEGSADLQGLRDAIEAMLRGAGQRDILTSLLDAAAAFYARTALFILKGKTLHGWGGLGFLGDNGFRSEHLARVTLSAGGSHLLAQALQRRSMTRCGPEGPGSELMAALGGVRVAEAVSMPILVRGRPVALLYADTGGERVGGQSAALEIASRFASLAMERLAGGAIRHEQGTAAAGVSATAEAVRAPSSSRAGALTPPEEAEVQALLGDLEPQSRRPSGETTAVNDEDRRRLADARRFARLLVSELLLYNEEAVVQGRKNRDLYARLGQEIDRSRQAFEARVPAHASQAAGYFDEELVRVLAQGDASLLHR